MELRRKLCTSRISAAVDAMAEKGSCKKRVRLMMNKLLKASLGAYGEAAALKAYPNCETVPCEKFEAVFEVVDLWLVEKAVLPIKNSVSGSIHHNNDLVLRHMLHIVGEVKLDLNHCLLGLPGLKKEELKSVLSHPQGSPGAYSEATALKAYAKCETVPCHKFKAVFTVKLAVNHCLFGLPGVKEEELKKVFSLTPQVYLMGVIYG